MKIFNQRRGQGSVEFLMTYGWAIALVLIVFVVAWQWGIFSIGSDVAAGAMGFWGVIPTDFRMTPQGALQVSLTNNVGGNVTLAGGNASMGSSVTELPYDVVIVPGGSMLIELTGLAPGNPGSRYEIILIIEYEDVRTGSTLHRSSGRVWGSYER